MELLRINHKGQWCHIKPIFCQEGLCSNCAIYEAAQNNNICTVNGCKGRRYAKGLCLKHYTRIRRYGSVELQRLSPVARFCKYTKLKGPLWNGSHCWSWTGTHIPSGYGRFSIKGQRVLAHRWAYEYFRGGIPQGTEIDHLCRNPDCVNPSHLEPVTHSENLRRGDIEAMSKHMKSKTHCPQGHPYDVENTWINKRGHRSCRKCHAERELLRYRSK